MSSPALMETLRAKAMLLLRREREVYQLRRERERIELWLNALHKLSLDSESGTSGPLIGDWVASMVGELRFQVAAVYACEPGGERLLLLDGMSHVPLSEALPLGAAARQLLISAQSGRCESARKSELGPLAEAAGLDSFVWHLVSSREQKLLLVAGFARGGSKNDAFEDADFRHFVLLGRHLGALLNIALIADIERERIELSQSNTLLGSRLQRLRDAQSKLVESTSALVEVSRRAGMADIATGVLHNVGNALNSVNVAAGVAVDRLRAMRVEGLGRVARLLEQSGPASGAPAGAELRLDRVVNYLRELEAHLSTERKNVTSELRALQESVEHIKIIVGKQQAYATAVGVVESCSAAQLMDDAISLSEFSLSELGIAVVREYAEFPEVMLDRHKVLQILVNLISNAKHALAERRDEPKQITTFVRLSPDGRVELGVRDNGVGVAEEHMSRLFTHGFTTKKHGHGFGLHTSALAARGMGGTLRCESAGRGRGATFVLELPVRSTPSQRVAS